MAKIQIKSEKLTPFGGIFSVMEQFERILSPVIDYTLGLRCRLFGYQYSEIFRSLMCVYFCGGSCVEDVTSHLMPHLSLHPTLRTCGADTILKAIGELTTESESELNSILVEKWEGKVCASSDYLHQGQRSPSNFGVADAQQKHSYKGVDLRFIIKGVNNVVFCRIDISFFSGKNFVFPDREFVASC